MKRRIQFVPVTLALGAVLFVAGCGGASDESVAWADGVCGSAQKFTNAATKQPQIDPTNPQAAIGALSTYLGSVITGTDDAIAGLRTAGPSPVEGGDQAVTKLTDALNGFRTTFGEAKTKLDAADPSDPSSIQGAVAPLTSLQNTPNPLADLQSNPELDEAAQKAPNCQALSRVGQQPGAGGTTGG